MFHSRGIGEKLKGDEFDDDDEEDEAEDFIFRLEETALRSKKNPNITFLDHDTYHLDEDGECIELIYEVAPGSTCIAIFSHFSLVAVSSSAITLHAAMLYAVRLLQDRETATAKAAPS